MAGALLGTGQLRSIVGGLVKGCLHEDSAIGQKLGEDVFLPLVCCGNSCGRVIGYALQEDLLVFP